MHNQSGYYFTQVCWHSMKTTTRYITLWFRTGVLLSFCRVLCYSRNCESFQTAAQQNKKDVAPRGPRFTTFVLLSGLCISKKTSHLSAHCNDCGTSFAFYDITTIAPKYVRVELTAVTVTSSGSFYSAWRWRSPPIKWLVTLIENISFKIRNCFLLFFFFSFYKGSSTDLHVVQVQLSHHNL